jgi:hypothetical protein
MNHFNLKRPGLVLSTKNLSSEKFSYKSRKFHNHNFFLKNQKFLQTSFLVLLAVKISADFYSEFLIRTQFEKSGIFRSLKILPEF